MRVPFLVCLIVGLLSGVGVPLEAQAPAATGVSPSSEAEARRLFDQGREAYQRELFTEAEDAFRAAYEAMPEGDERKALLLSNVAQSIERQGGRDDDALEAWRTFEREAEGVAGEDALGRARERIRELEARVSRRQIAEAPALVEAPAIDEPSPDLSPTSEGRSPHWAGFAVLGAGGAMAIAGGVVGIVGLRKRSALLERCDGTLCPADARSDAERLDTLGRTADILLWPGLAVAAAGAILVFTLDADSGDGRALSASCGLGGCSLEGSF